MSPEAQLIADEPAFPSSSPVVPEGQYYNGVSSAGMTFHQWLVGQALARVCAVVAIDEADSVCEMQAERRKRRKW